jgi:3-methyladenine DNA glycosylase AlkD
MEKEDKATAIIHRLESFVNEEKRAFLPHFFKTGKGEYGEGDKFLGIVVPNIRKVAKEYRGTSLETVGKLLLSPWHEVRMFALLLLVDAFKQGKEKQHQEIFNYYLAHTSGINNWDLVDLSAPYIVGAYLLDEGRTERQVLYRLADSDNLWEQRIAVVSTITLIRNNEFDEILKLAQLLMKHPHDLMQKAIGWMLREVGKKNETVLRSFLDAHGLEMPRTMLRYAIERFDENVRQYYLKRR